MRRVLAKAVFMSSESLFRLGAGKVGTKPRPLQSADIVAGESVLVEKLTTYLGMHLAFRCLLQPK